MGTYSISEVYRTIIGEGHRQGQPAAVIRFQGCNLWSGRPGDRKDAPAPCARWCDASFNVGQSLSTEEILAALDSVWPEAPGRRVLLTGGEPLLQVDDALERALHDAGWTLGLETNGTIDAPVRKYMDWLVVSPKLGTDLVVKSASELRIVVPGAMAPEQAWKESDILRIGEEGDWRHRYIVPMDPMGTAGTFLTNVGGSPTLAGVFQIHLKWATDFVSRHPGWTLGVQAGKLIGIETL